MIKTFLIITALSFNGNLWLDYYPMKDMKECKEKLLSYNKIPKAATKTSAVCWNSQGDIKHGKR